MRKYTYEELRDLVLDIIEAPAAKRGFERAAIDETRDLMKAGYLDSFAVIDTIMELESRTGVSIDLNDAGSSEISSVAGLINSVLAAQG